MMTKSEATKRARLLMKRVKGKGWRYFIFENLGWHFHLHLGELKLYEYEDARRSGHYHYSTLMGDEKGSPGGACQFTKRGQSFSDPNKAVMQQVRLAREWTDRYCQQVQEIVEEVETALGIGNKFCRQIKAVWREPSKAHEITSRPRKRPLRWTGKRWVPIKVRR